MLLTKDRKFSLDSDGKSEHVVGVVLSLARQTATVFEGEVCGVTTLGTKEDMGYLAQCQSLPEAVEGRCHQPQGGRERRPDAWQSRGHRASRRCGQLSE